jgi:hypothetical protein
MKQDLTLEATPAPHLPPASQKFMPALGLRISTIFDLQPGVSVVLVNAEFALRHNPLEVTGANFREKVLPVLLDVLSIKQPWTLRGPDKSREALLSLDKGRQPQVLAIKPQKVEGAKDWLDFPAEQLVELADTLTIEAHNLAIGNCSFDRQFGQRFFQRLKSQVSLIARDDLAVASLQVRDPPETVVF